jgi:hypothetical protein
MRFHSLGIGIEAVRLAAEGEEVLGEALEVPDALVEDEGEPDDDEDDGSGGAAMKISF